jgi:hypothetical protein
MFSWNGIDLVPEHFLDVSDLFLCLTFDLFRFALGLQARVSEHLAGDFLDVACDGFGGAFYLVVSARFHVFDFLLSMMASVAEAVM